MTELHIWTYTSIAVTLITVALGVWAKSEMERLPVHHGVPAIIALMPLGVFITAISLRLLGGIVMWMLGPLF